MKTFFKIIVICLPWFICSLPAPYQRKFEVMSLFDSNICKSTTLFVLTYSPLWCPMIIILLTEFVVYPLVKIEPPSILKRIGITCFFSLLLIILYVIDHFYHLQLHPWSLILYSVCYGSFIFLFLLSFVTLFVCAQSPYNMRGLLTGYSIVLHFTLLGISSLLFRITEKLLENYENKDIVRWSLAAALSLVGFILHCVFACWYK